MPIYRLLQNADFHPEHVAVMTAAFEDVCRDLGLAEREDPLRDIVARAIIECAQTGERDLINCESALTNRCNLSRLRPQRTAVSDHALSSQAANRALELLGKNFGLFIDRAEIGSAGEFNSII